MAQTKVENTDVRSPSAGVIPPNPYRGGTKRKRDDAPKFYAVHVGRKPGVYYTWDDAKAQVSGVKGCLYQKFSSFREADEFVKTGLSRTIKKYYGVRRGRIPGVYTHWPEVQEQITGWTKPLQRAFDTQAEALAFVNGNDNPEPGASATLQAEKSKGSRKKQPRTASATEIDASVPPGEGPMPPIDEDSFDAQTLLDPESGRLRYKTDAEYNAAKMQASRLVAGKALRIYTDGSALGNGQKGSVAGVGVYFGPKDSRNVSEGITGGRQTNQRAELTAIQRAVELAPRDSDITIVSDSQYSIKCVTEWFPRWRDNEWKTSNGKPVENKDLVEAIVWRIEQRNKLGVKTLFEWIKGHAEDAGNTAADALAVAGAERAKLRGATDVPNSCVPR